MSAKKRHILTLTEVIACLEAIRDELDPGYTENINPALMIDVKIDGVRERLGIEQIFYKGTVNVEPVPGYGAKAEVAHELTIVTDYREQGAK